MAKEQKARSDLQVKFDTIIEEKNLLSKKIKDLEVANVELSEKISVDVIHQSPLDKSTESVCSFKTASSFISEKVSRKNSVKPKTVDTSQIRPTNLFYNHSIDGTVKSNSKILGKQSRTDQMVWVVKGSLDGQVVQNHLHPHPKLNRTELEKNDFVHRESAHNWYGTYRITSQTNVVKRHKPIEKWIRKSNKPGP
ncbi:hypothetical protein L6452_42083 [Arctium lappa]|uniref:Uncharacterized protein n=1 Tax=Arctium lappa TaxID=4217 RepID=A0ACB8XIF9_ARCLA|nr:hypothetical protein L6452_42083 [Arctium lappa]